jgi:3'-phosphoadenosine 5'-phosphosulfate sulfotransferase
MVWLYQGQPFEDPGIYYGFVYIIINKLDNRKYIGKKFFWSSKTKQIKGKKKKIKVESDWKDYWSSSEEVKKDVAELGEENFTKEILHLCKTKGTANYYEAFEQMQNRVLENQELWYNRHIQCRVHYTHIKK